MNINEFCSKLDRLLSSRELQGEGLDTAIKAICQGLSSSAGEVAIMLVDEEAEALRFLWPRGLQASGSVPFSCKSSLAAKTFRNIEGSVNNRFSAVRHASIFEALPLKEQGGKALPIQKILSVPISTQESCIGVLQVCRKAADPNEAGPDFTQEDLINTELIAKTLARHLN